MRRATRECIRKAKGLTRSEREILQHLTALWYHHRKSAGEIRPGKKAIARKCQCSVPTVTRALARFRKMALIAAVKYAKGGRNATRYTVNISAILMQFDGYLLSLKGAELHLTNGKNTLTMHRSDFIGLSGKNDPVSPKIKPDQNDPRSICMFQQESSKVLPLKRSAPKLVSVIPSGESADLAKKQACQVFQFPAVSVRGAGHA